MTAKIQTMARMAAIASASSHGAGRHPPMSSATMAPPAMTTVSGRYTAAWRS